MMSRKKFILSVVIFICGVFSGWLLNFLDGNTDEFINLPDNVGSSMLLHDDIGYVSKFGYVSNKETALKIAKAVWLPITNV
jgi:hypothetical protein